MQTRYDVKVCETAGASVLTLYLHETRKGSITSTTLCTPEDFQDALARALGQVGKRFVRLIPFMGEKVDGFYWCDVIAEDIGDPANALADIDKAMVDLWLGRVSAEVGRTILRKALEAHELSKPLAEEPQRNESLVDRHMSP